MTVKFLWRTSWTDDQAKVLAYNEKWVIGGTNGKGIVAAVEFPLPSKCLSWDGTDLGFEFFYSANHVPKVVHYMPLDSSENEFKPFDVPKELKRSMIALLGLAHDWTEFRASTRLDRKNEDGIVTSVKFRPRHDGTRVRTRWLIAWFWPRWNACKMTNEERAAEINRFFKECGLRHRITAGTLKTTANRMELFFG